MAAGEAGRGRDEKKDRKPLFIPVKAEPAIPVNTGSAAAPRAGFPMRLDFGVNIRPITAYTVDIPALQDVFGALGKKMTDWGPHAKRD